MSSLIYIAVVIVIAIISNVNKAGKNKTKTNTRGGMPTFGGGGDGSPLRRPRTPDRLGDHEQPSRQGSGFPTPGAGGGSVYTSQSPMSYEEPGYDSSPVWNEPAHMSSPDYETGEGVSLEQPEEDSVQIRTERMQRELERVRVSFDGMAVAADADSARSTGDVRGSSAVSAHSPVRRGLADSREDLRNGLVWSEILGPPRSRNPHSTRRQA